MKSPNLKNINLHYALFGGIVVVLALSLYVAYQYRLLASELELLAQSNSELASSLDKEATRADSLFTQTIEQQAIIDNFQGQIEGIASTVGDLEKLAQTDEELLKKYSKVYFLNENYVPAKLSDIPEEYLYDGTDNFLIHTDVLPFLRRLLDEARSDGIDLLIASAFRSFDEQASLKAGYTFIYGAGTANQFSADQGYSEHQLGTSVDFTTSTIGGNFSRFVTSPAYKWLLENAHRYGFTLSYPEGNSYYKFEPWHWRFVGVDLARDLEEDGKYFYDLDQREIDSYLIKLFD